jgi:hypothetical protein
MFCTFKNENNSYLVLYFFNTFNTTKYFIAAIRKNNYMHIRNYICSHKNLLKLNKMQKIVSDFTMASFQ